MPFLPDIILAQSTDPWDTLPDYLGGRPSDHFITVSPEERLLSTAIIGATGMGKSAMLYNLMYQDLYYGNGFCLLEPHSDLCRSVLDAVPAHRLEDVVYVNLADLEFPSPLNPLESFDAGQQHLIASGLVSIFKRFWGDSIGPRSEYLLRNCVLALLEHPGATLLQMQRLLHDDEFRESIVQTLANPAVRSFWTDEFAHYTPSFRELVISPILNKTGEFSASALIRNVVGQRKNLFQLRRLMDEGKIVIFDLAKGKVGEDTAYLLGSMIFTQLMLAAFSRQDIPEKERRLFTIYADEFTNVATPSTLVTFLTEAARKCATPIVAATQMLANMEDQRLRGAFFGAGTVVSFRVNADDAQYVANELWPVTPHELTGLDRFHAFIRRRGSRASEPISAVTLPPVPSPISYREQIIQRSRAQYARPRDVVEREAARHFLPSRSSEPKRMVTAKRKRAKLPVPPRR